jgi:hypothetical protein
MLLGGDIVMYESNHIGRIVVGHSDGTQFCYAELLCSDVCPDTWGWLNLHKVCKKINKKNATTTVCGMVFGAGKKGGSEGLIRQAMAHDSARVLRTLELPGDAAFMGILPNGWARFVQITSLHSAV